MPEFRVKLRRSSTSGSVPSVNDLELGELAVNTYDGKIFTKKDDGQQSIVEVGVGTDLTWTASTRTIASSSGTNAIITNATTSDSGLMSSSDKSKLDGIQSGAQVNVGTDLSYVNSTREVQSSTGTNATLPEVVAGGVSGFMTGSDKTKLDGIATGAQVNVGTDLSYTSATRALASSTGTDVTLPLVSSGGSAGLMSGSDKTKLDSIQSNAEINVNADWNATQGDAEILNKPSIPQDLDDLSNVDTTTPTDGQVLAWDNTNSYWAPADASSGITDLSYTSSTRVISSSTGTDATLPEVTAAGDSGLMTGADKTKLDGIETGATADQTAQEILTEIKTVDGSSSGLDADLLDGVEGSSYLRSDTSDTSTGILDLNGGIRFVTTNAGGNGLSFVDNGYQTRWDGRETLTNQTVVHKFSRQGYNTGNFNAYVENWYDSANYHSIGLTTGGVLQYDSNTVWHAGNDGSGSGLDADTLDGVQGSSYLRSDTFDTAAQDITFTGGGGAITLGAGSSLHAFNGTWTGNFSSNAGKIQLTDNYWKLQSSNGIYYRDSNNADNLVWHAGNDGSGSGLDADTLDGQQGSYYLDYNNFTNTPTGGGNSDLQGYEDYEVLLDFGSDAANTERRIISASLANIQYSTIGFQIDVIDNNANHATTSSTSTVEKSTYYVNCVRTDSTTLNSPDSVTIKGPSFGDLIRARKVSQGNYEVTAKNTTQWREYRINIKVIAVNGSHTITYRNGDTPSTAAASYTSSSASTNIDYFQAVKADSYTANGNTVWHAGNDGAGSGLDADKLDGYQENIFMRRNANSDLVMNSQSLHFGASNTNSKIRWSGTTSLWDLISGDLKIRDNTTDRFTFARTTGNFTASGTITATSSITSYTSIAASTGMTVNSNTVWHAGNDGSGSGLDADTVDGIQASAFVTETEITNYSINPRFTDSIGFGNDTAVLYFNDATSTSKTVNAVTYWSNKDRFEVRGDGNSRNAVVLSTGNVEALDNAYIGNNLGVGVRLDIGDQTNGNSEIRIYKGDNDVSDHIQFYNGGTRIGEIGCEDTTWLRINQETAKNIYTPRYIRADGGFFVDGTSKGIDGSGNYKGGTISGASDYGTLLRSDVADSATQRITFNANNTNNWDTIATSSGSQGGLEVYNSGAGNDAFMTFHSGGDFACYFGLDADNNSLSVGGWSMGANKYKIWHSGNDGSGSGLDADTLDGQDSAFYRNADNINAGTFPDRFSSGTRYNIGYIDGHSGDNYDKLRVYSSSSYTIGMKSAQTFGWLNDWAMTFTFNNETDRGFLWRDTSDTAAQGAMSLTTNGNLCVANVIAVGGQTTRYLREPSGNYGSIQIQGSGYGNWEGFSIDGRSVFMHDGANGTGIYNDVDNEWFFYGVRNSYTRMYHNGATCIQTSGGSSATIGGNNIWHAGNDGSGSGLDADTLDGQQASAFVSTSGSPVFTSNLKLNDSYQLQLGNDADVKFYHEPLGVETKCDINGNDFIFYSTANNEQFARFHYGTYTRAFVVGKTIRTNYTANSNAVKFVVEGRADLDGCQIHGGRAFTSPPSRLVAVGGSAVTFSSSTGRDNTACGYAALYRVLDGFENVAIGSYAGSDEEHGDYNVFIGGGCAEHADDETYRNVYIGYQAGYDNNFDDCVMIGYRSGFSQDYTNGNKNTYIGSYTAYSKRRGENNTLIGYQAGRYLQSGSSDSSTSSYYSNTTCLGYDSRISGSNQVQLGNSSTTTYAYGSVQNRSDARDKTDIRPTILGLDFIKRLKPVDFRWDYRDDYTKMIERDETKAHSVMVDNPDFVPGGDEPEQIKIFEDVTETLQELVPAEKDGSKARTRFHHGLIAQDVKETMDEMGIDFAGYQDHSIKEGLDVLSIGYTELIGPMIRAIQEQQEQIQDLQDQVNSLMV